MGETGTGVGSAGGRSRLSSLIDRSHTWGLLFLVGTVACQSPNTTAPEAGLHAEVTRDASPSDVDAAQHDAPTINASDASLDAAPDVDADIGAMSEDALGLLAEVATIAESNKSDCDALAQRLDAFYDRHVTFIKKATDTYKHASHPEQARLRTRYQARFNASWKKLQPPVKRCKDDPAVKELLDRVFPTE